MTHLLPRDPDLEITEETHQTWQVRNWDELEKKVEAVKNIEKSMIQRDSGMEGKQ